MRKKVLCKLEKRTKQNGYNGRREHNNRYLFILAPRDYSNIDPRGTELIASLLSALSDVLSALSDVLVILFVPVLTTLFFQTKNNKNQTTKSSLE